MTTDAEMTGDWVQRGACFPLRKTVGSVRGALAVFYPGPGKHMLQFALICDMCEVRCECLSWGILAEDWGRWGGTEEDDRKAMRKGISEGFTTLADILRERDCADMAEHLEEADAAAVAEAAAASAQPTSVGDRPEGDGVDGADGERHGLEPAHAVG